MPSRKGNRIQIAAYLDDGTYEALQSLSKGTRVPAAAYIREAVEDLLAKYKVKIPKQRAKK